MTGTLSRQARILVVEDERSILSAIRRGMAFEGYTVEVAETGSTRRGKPVSAPAISAAATIAARLFHMTHPRSVLFVCRRIYAGGS